MGASDLRNIAAQCGRLRLAKTFIPLASVKKTIMAVSAVSGRGFGDDKSRQIRGQLSRKENVA
jgi:hypothetical protein